MGSKISYGVIVGRPFSGKTTLSKCMASTMGYKVIDMKATAEKVKTTLGTEEEPFEGDVPLNKIEENIASCINKAKKCKYIFDGFSHPKAEDFEKFIE